MAFKTALAKFQEQHGRGFLTWLAKQSGISPQYANQLLKQDRYGSEAVRRKIAAALGFTYEEFLEVGRGLKSELRKAARPLSPNVVLASHLNAVPEITLENYFAAPLISGSVAAGTGGILSETDIESYVWIYGPELKERMHHDLIAVRVDRKNGDSMRPTLRPGDIVLVDKNDPSGDPHAFKSGALYAVRDGKGGTCVKRLHRDKKAIIVTSDNPEFPPEISWTGNILELIIGRVVWGWRNLLDIR